MKIEKRWTKFVVIVGVFVLLTPIVFICLRNYQAKKARWVVVARMYTELSALANSLALCHEYNLGTIQDFSYHPGGGERSILRTSWYAGVYRLVEDRPHVSTGTVDSQPCFIDAWDNPVLILEPEGELDPNRAFLIMRDSAMHPVDKLIGFLGSCGPNGEWEDGTGDDIVAPIFIARWLNYVGGVGIRENKEDSLHVPSNDSSGTNGDRHRL